MSTSLKTQALAEYLQTTGVLHTPHIIEAFQSIDRADFLPELLRSEVSQDVPLPIGEGQTISQPYTVAFMLELLQPAPGHHILDIGSGSGWQTALLAAIVSNPSTAPNAASGRVIGMERIKSLCTFGAANLEKYHFITTGAVKIICGDASIGYQPEAPYDRIIAAAAVTKIPEAWCEQLKIGGCLVVPQGNALVVLQKKSVTAWEQEIYPGFFFVPFITDESHYTSERPAAGS